MIWEIRKGTNMGKVKAWMMDMEEKVDDALTLYMRGSLDNECDILDYVQSHMDIVDKPFVLNYVRSRLKKDQSAIKSEYWKGQFKGLF